MPQYWGLDGDGGAEFTEGTKGADYRRSRIRARLLLITFCILAVGLQTLWIAFLTCLAIRVLF